MPDDMNTINRRILLIDDERPVHEAYHKILAPKPPVDTGFDELEAAMFGDEDDGSQAAEASGTGGSIDFELSSAHQGQEGVEMCQAAMTEGRPYAMAFVDMRMPPGIDGLETIVQLWEIDPSLQVVICSAYTDYSWDQVRDRIGYSSRLLILKKPFENIEVHQMAAAFTEKWSLARTVAAQVDTLEHTVEERTKDLKQAERQLMQAEKMASIGQLAAGVAHEINNPIGFIASNLGTLGTYVDDLNKVFTNFTDLQQAIATRSPDIQAKHEAAAATAKQVDLDFLLQDLQSIVAESIEGTDRVRKIVSDLRDFSHVDDDTIKPEDLNQLITKTIGMAHNELKHKAEIKTELGELPPVHCNGGKIAQVVMNLVVNAAQAIETSGTITVRTGILGSRVWLEVEDTGCGMDPEVMSKVFDPFFTTKDVGEGTGLGLNLAYNIIDAHNGSINVKSQVGKGTTFRIKMPIDEPGSAKKDQSKAA